MAKPLACDMESPAHGYTNFVILRKKQPSNSAASHLCPIIHAYEVNIYSINVSLVLLHHNLHMPCRVVSERGVEGVIYVTYSTSVSGANFEIANPVHHSCNRR
jgi:hypothetical protein